VSYINRGNWREEAFFKLCGQTGAIFELGTISTRKKSADKGKEKKVLKVILN
jgi:hypothetical protein